MSYFACQDNFRISIVVCIIFARSTCGHIKGRINKRCIDTASCQWQLKCPACIWHQPGILMTVARIMIILEQLGLQIELWHIEAAAGYIMHASGVVYAGMSTRKGRPLKKASHAEVLRNNESNVKYELIHPNKKNTIRIKSVNKIIHQRG
jgi:hypothetical protein